jgi:hypothetical protein
MNGLGKRASIVGMEIEKYTPAIGAIRHFATEGKQTKNGNPSKRTIIHCTKANGAEALKTLHIIAKSHTGAFSGLIHIIAHPETLK